MARGTKAACMCTNGGVVGGVGEGGGLSFRMLWCASIHRHTLTKRFVWRVCFCVGDTTNRRIFFSGTEEASFFFFFFLYLSKSVDDLPFLTSPLAPILLAPWLAQLSIHCSSGSGDFGLPVLCNEEAPLMLMELVSPPLTPPVCPTVTVVGGRLSTFCNHFSSLRELSESFGEVSLFSYDSFLPHFPGLLFAGFFFIIRSHSGTGNGDQIRHRFFFNFIWGVLI